MTSLKIFLTVASIIIIGICVAIFVVERMPRPIPPPVNDADVVIQHAIDDQEEVQRLIPISDWKQSSNDHRPVLTLEEAWRIRDEVLNAVIPPEDGTYTEIDAEVEELFHLSQQAPPNTTVHVSFGDFSADLPYNTRWLSDRFLLPPFYAEKDGAVGFGSLVYDWHGFAFYRKMSVETVDPRSAEDALQEVKASGYLSENFVPVIVQIGDIEAVEYVDSYPESAEGRVFEVIGKNCNYVFRCSGDGYMGPDGDCSSLQKTVESVTFVD